MQHPKECMTTAAGAAAEAAVHAAVACKPVCSPTAAAVAACKPAYSPTAAAAAACKSACSPTAAADVTSSSAAHASALAPTGVAAAQQLCRMPPTDNPVSPQWRWQRRRQWQQAPSSFTALLAAVLVAALLLATPSSTNGGGSDRRGGGAEVSGQPRHAASGGPHAASVRWAQRHPEFGYRSALPRNLLDRTRAVMGDETRARAFVRKLVSGEPSKFAVLGSSLASCRGATHMDSGWPALLHKWMELAFTPCASTLPRGARFFEPSPEYWFQRQRHLCDASTVQYIDMAVYASTPLFSELCMLPKVPPDVDAVIIEYGVNDMEYQAEFDATVASGSAPMARALMHTTERRALERLVRSLLLLPSAPAVLLLEVYSWGMSSRAARNFALLPEDYHAPMARYYGNVQLLSSRAVLHPLLTGSSGAWVDNLSADDIAASGLYQPDGIHPSNAGHRLYADVLIHYLQGLAHSELALASAAQPMPAAGPENAFGKAAASGGDGSGSGSSSSNGLQGRGAGYGSVDAGTADADPDAAWLARLSTGLERALPLLPPPMADGNWESGSRRCFLNHDVQPLVGSNDGFEFVDEGGTLQNGWVRHKFGLVAKSPGASLTLTLDTTLGGGATDRVQVLVSHLKSYQRMGAARISCVGGCVCAPLVVQAFDTGGANVSLTSFAALSVTAHPQCQMQVTVLESRGPDGGNKFKVIGVVLHDSPYGAHIPLLGGDHIDYVETKVSGFMPGGFGAGADVRGDLGGD